ncbi:MAG: AFG1 family ATPase [Alphaproteobacteria bacterium]|nr:AFG1 family ATPase [Alphaproteobacteria bacterium]MBV9695081.1 AFG1 family ATPase [Alphaproteobacteria bacterium]
MSLLQEYRRALAAGALKSDAGQERLVQRLQSLAHALGRPRLFGRSPPRGLYIWGDVGRGKTMLLDLFFDAVRITRKRRIHFNAFMVESHARLHDERKAGQADPIAAVAKLIASEAGLLCFDEFQVSDVADAMILGRLFEQLFERRVVIVATSNTAPARLYQGGLNRELFLPFIALIEARLDVVELAGAADYRRLLLGGMNVYLTPLGAEAEAAMNEDWRKLTGQAHGAPATLNVLGRTLQVPCAAKGVARFPFEALCLQPLGQADYLALARSFHTLFIDRIPKLEPAMADAARRFSLLIDTLYDENVKLVCSAAEPPDRLYVQGAGAEAFRRTASRLLEMQSREYLERDRA